MVQTNSEKVRDEASHTSTDDRKPLGVDRAQRDAAREISGFVFGTTWGSFGLNVGRPVIVQALP